MFVFSCWKPRPVTSARRGPLQWRGLASRGRQSPRWPETSRNWISSRETQNKQDRHLTTIVSDSVTSERSKSIHLNILFVQISVSFCNFMSEFWLIEIISFLSAFFMLLGFKKKKKNSLSRRESKGHGWGTRPLVIIHLRHVWLKAAEYPNYKISPRGVHHGKWWWYWSRVLRLFTNLMERKKYFTSYMRVFDDVSREKMEEMCE